MKQGKVKGVFYRNSIAYIRFQDELGNDVRESTGQRSSRVAEQILAKRRTEVAMHKHFPTRRFQHISFQELRDYWWEHHGTFTRSPFNYLIPRIDARFGELKARQIIPEHIEEFMKDLRAQGLSASTANHYRTILNSTFNFAISRGKYDLNPVVSVSQMKEPPGRDRVPTRQEFHKLHTYCRLHDQKWTRKTGPFAKVAPT